MRSLLIAASVMSVSLLPARAEAGAFWDWLTGRNRVAAPAIPVGPPIYTPNPNPPVVGDGPVVPATTVAPAATAPANFAPTLVPQQANRVVTHYAPAQIAPQHCPTCPTAGAVPA